MKIRIIKAIVTKVWKRLASMKTMPINLKQRVQVLNNFLLGICIIINYRDNLPVGLCDAVSEQSVRNIILNPVLAPFLTLIPSFVCSIFNLALDSNFEEVKTGNFPYKQIIFQGMLAMS